MLGVLTNRTSISIAIFSFICRQKCLTNKFINKLAELKSSTIKKTFSPGTESEFCESEEKQNTTGYSYTWSRGHVRICRHTDYNH